jgi:hypothetical protein
MTRSILWAVFLIICAFAIASCTGRSSSAGIAPAVISVTPANGNENAAINPVLSVNFNEAMDPGSITASTIILKDSSNNAISGTVSYDIAAMKATFTPADLNSNTTYTATVTTGVKDIAGNSLAAAYSWSFTTAAFSCPEWGPPSPDWCSGGTILPSPIDENGCSNPPICQTKAKTRFVSTQTFSFTSPVDPSTLVENQTVYLSSSPTVTRPETYVISNAEELTAFIQMTDTFGTEAYYQNMFSNLDMQTYLLIKGPSCPDYYEYAGYQYSQSVILIAMNHFISDDVVCPASFEDAFYVLKGTKN